MINNDKNAIRDFWNEASCGEKLYLQDNQTKEGFEEQARIRYLLEPYIKSFADFDSGKGKTVLEVGVGLGADHQKWAMSGANLYGIDLTQRAVENTTNRLKLFGLNSSLEIADAESLPFENEFFDIVYSWGVIHHSPDTHRAVNEIYRVLKKGGVAKIMIYHKYSFVGYMLWLRYGLLRFRPFTSLKTIYSRYLESPGTKAYSINEANELMSQFREVKISTILTHGDLLSSKAGQRHSGILLSIGRKIFPRNVIKRLFPKHGLFMMIEAEK